MPIPQPAFGEAYVSSVDAASRKLTITAASYPLTITQGSASGDVVTIPADHDLVLRADRVIIKGAIRSPGRSITIYARVVESDDGSIITSGVSGTAPPPPEPMDSRVPRPGTDERYTKKGGQGERGIDGHHGATGDPGKPGGPITLFAGELRGKPLVLQSNGGNGGAGQGAQAAVAGARGGKGGDPAGNPRYNPAGDGGDGGDGGNGGNGGPGGAGGAGGKITVRVLRNFTASQVQVQAKGGSGGAGGAATNGAAGGEGGRDGEHGDDGPRTKPGKRGENGRNGTAGAQGATPAPTTAEVRAASAADLKDGVNAPHLQMILRLANLRLLLRDENRQEIASMLAYVMDLAATKTADPQVAAALQRANALLFQTARGLDPQGHPQNFAPRLDIETYRANLDRFVSSFKGLRDEYQKYFNTQSTREQRIQGLSEIREKAAALLNDLDAQSKEGLEIAEGLIKLTDVAQQRAGTQLLKWRQKLNEFEAQLKQVAKEKACVLDTLDALVKGFDALTLTGDATVKKVAGYAHDAKKLIDGAIPAELKPAALEKAISKLESLGDSVSDVASAYKQNKDLIISQTDPNAYKLMVSQAQLNSILEPYLSKFGTAVELKAAMDDYVKLVQTRNDLILKFNEQIAALAGVKARHAETTAQRAQAEKLLQEKADPIGVEFCTFAGNAFHASKEMCVEQLYLTWKAAVFYSLDRSFDVFERIRTMGARTDLDWAAFKAGADAVVKHLQEAEEKFSADVIPYPRKEEDEGIIVTIKDQASLAALRANKRVIVHLTPAFSESAIVDNPFAGLADCRVTRARAWLVGATTTDKKIALYLTHTGLDTIVDRKSKALDFIHREVPTRLVYKTDEPKKIEGGDIRLPGSKYAAVGPFTDWRVSIDPNENRGLDLSGLTEIRLEFHVTHRVFEGKVMVGNCDARAGTVIAVEA
ncbi:hypothetical protein [Tahibacter amnicola]|uniref:Collagen triple helix repeat protein n=1 Tax=Tahibacter amnicola TaxID=2976241 RepID=A0ABY6B8A6_9GAMM|nr:hypothetical protein [Tahibacter amnicola]UXI65797.1 hypothetical protein N4264_13590 [Tahibacter amnicola]